MWWSTDKTRRAFCHPLATAFSWKRFVARPLSEGRVLVVPHFRVQCLCRRMQLSCRRGVPRNARKLLACVVVKSCSYLLVSSCPFSFSMRSNRRFCDSINIFLSHYVHPISLFLDRFGFTVIFWSLDLARLPKIKILELSVIRFSDFDIFVPNKLHTVIQI